MLAVYAGRECAGFFLSHGRDGVEAFSASNKSLGLFPDQESAADAVAHTGVDIAYQTKPSGSGI
jgi:hypothetical protein